MDSSNNLHKEKELFSLIAEGNETAFEQLFNLYVPQIQKIIYPIVQSEAVVKDIAQEVFLSVWLGRDKLTEIEVPQRWIFRIAYNQSFRYLKRLALQKRSLAGLGTDEGSDISYETEKAVDLSEATRLFREAIRELPEQGRKIFEMSRIAGMKPAEIAEKLQISVQGVRNSLTRSGKFVREYLDERGLHLPVILIIFSSF